MTAVQIIAHCLPCRTQLLQLRKKRMCSGFVAEDRASGELIGCAFASFLAAEAMLPPPWPTSKPARYYMSNLAVLPEHRRRGAALALLKACELLGGCCPGALALTGMAALLPVFQGSLNLQEQRLTPATCPATLSMAQVCCRKLGFSGLCC